MNPDLAKTLLAWFDREARALPWREKDGTHGLSYAVLVSELCSQQKPPGVKGDPITTVHGALPRNGGLRQSDENGSLK